MVPIFSGNNSARYGAFFDLDDTLINGNSGRLLVRYAWEKSLISWGDLLNAIWLSIQFRFGLKAAEKIVYDMLAWMKGVPERNLGDLSSGSFAEQLFKLISGNARSEVAFHKSHQAKTVILSSAIEPVCNLVATHLQIDDIICTVLESRNGYFTGSVTGNLCFGNEKLTRLEKYCRDNSINPEESWYYSDSISDLPVLGAVGYPVCINPDRQLKRIARKNNWRTEIWR